MYEPSDFAPLSASGRRVDESARSCADQRDDKPPEVIAPSARYAAQAQVVDRHGSRPKQNTGAAPRQSHSILAGRSVATIGAGTWSLCSAIISAICAWMRSSTASRLVTREETLFGNGVGSYPSPLLASRKA